MLRPIESNLSILNVEQKASQVKDPNAHQFQAMQNDEIVKNTQHQTQTVQTVEKPEGNRVRERRDDPEGRRRKKKGRGAGEGGDASGETQPEDSDPRGGLNFLA